MKNKINLIPFLLLALYYLFLGRNDNAEFEVKMIVLLLIIILSFLVLYINYKNNLIPKNRIITLVVFLGISLLSFLWFFFK